MGIDKIKGVLITLAEGKSMTYISIYKGYEYNSLSDDFIATDTIF